MRSGVVAQKVGMTRVFTEAGEHVPVTVLRLAQCQVVAHRTKDKNGYVALQLGSGPRRTNNMIKSDRGYFAKAKVEPKRKLAEFRVSEDGLIPVGAEITADHFVEGQFVDVIGVSKGKSFQGVVKKHHVQGGPAAHGSMFHRRIGSIGMRQTPGRSWKNQAMPGHLGSEHCTMQNLHVVKVLPEKNLLLVKGAIPGANGDDVIVRTAIKGRPKAAK